MKKYSIILGSISLLLISLTSCKKNFLDEKPYSAYTPITLTDSLGFEAELIGLYQRQTGILTWGDHQGWPSVW